MWKTHSRGTNTFLSLSMFLNCLFFQSTQVKAGDETEWMTITIESMPMWTHERAYSFIPLMAIWDHLVCQASPCAHALCTHECRDQKTGEKKKRKSSIRLPTYIASCNQVCATNCKLPIARFRNTYIRKGTWYSMPVATTIFVVPYL